MAKPRTRMDKPKQNRIPLPFEKAIDGLLSVKPKRKTRKKSKRSKK